MNGDSDETPSRCILLDINVPFMDRFEVVARMQKTGCNKPAMLIAGGDSAEMQNRAISAESVGFFHKPCVLDAIIEGIETSSTGRTPCD